MQSIKSHSPSQKFKNFAPKKQEFISYKDFTSEKSMESADFEFSFNEVNGSFCSSSNDAKDLIIEYQAIYSTPSQKKLKEDETNYTSKPILVLEKESQIKRSWCSTCLGETQENFCLIL